MKCRFIHACLLAGLGISATLAAETSAPAIPDAPPAPVQPLMPGKPVINHLFYLPTRDEPATPATWGHRFRRVDFPSKDGTELHGWWIESEVRPVRGTVVFSHGNAGSMGHHLGFVMWLPKAGYEVMTYDYRGYGRSGGETDRQGMVEDVQAALSFAAGKGSRRHQPVISYGHSLGGAQSVAAIANDKTEDLRAVIVDATFSSYREMARIVGGRLAADLVTDEFAPVGLVQKISPLPLLVIHGKRDPVVPFSQGLKLFQAAAKPKTLFEVEEGHHGNCLSRDNGAYRKKMLAWLDEQLKN